MTAYPNERPLSDFWTDDQRRLHALQVDRIITRHRMIYAEHRLAVEAEHRAPKEIEL